MNHLDTGVAVMTVHGSRDVGLDCADADLRAVLEAELRSRLAVRVHQLDQVGPQASIRLAPGVEFLTAIRALPRPALVSVFSGSDRVHRLASIATAIHGGDGVAYLPAVPGNRDSTDRARRLARLVAADYSALPWARHRLAVQVAPLPLISAYSWSELIMLLGRREHGPRRSTDPSDSMERSLQTSVKEP